MKKIILILFILSFLSGGELNIIESKFDFNQTISKITQLLKEKNYNIITIIDYKSIAKKTPFNCNNEKLIIFTKNQEFTRIILNDQRAGIEPFRFLIYQDYDQKVKILYKDPLILKENFNLKNCSILPALSKEFQEIIQKIKK